MRMKKRCIVIGLLFILSIITTACAKKDSTNLARPSSPMETADRGSSDGMTVNTSQADRDFTVTAGKASNEVTMESKATNSGSDTLDDNQMGISSTSSITSGETIVQAQDKIIRRFYLELETQEFDDLISKIDQRIDQLGGYVESSEIKGKRYYNADELRYGRIIVRIPRDRVDEFVNIVDENANVVNKEESSENVTLDYIDIESRKKSLEIEQERLFVLLEKADKLESIVTLESRLTDIRYELQKYETQLRTYDNLVDYSTVTLNIQEVERMTPTMEEKQTVWNRIENGFSDTMFNISEGLKNFFVWFVINLPYLIICGGIITGIVLFIRRIYNKNMQGDNTSNKQSPSSGLGQNRNNQENK